MLALNNFGVTGHIAQSPKEFGGFSVIVMENLPKLCIKHGVFGYGLCLVEMYLLPNDGMLEVTRQNTSALLEKTTKHNWGKAAEMWML